MITGTAMGLTLITVSFAIIMTPANVIKNLILSVLFLVAIAFLLSMAGLLKNLDGSLSI